MKPLQSSKPSNEPVSEESKSLSEDFSNQDPDPQLQAEQKQRKKTLKYDVKKNKRKTTFIFLYKNNIFNDNKTADFYQQEFLRNIR